jgi:hypothetical protein
MDAQPIRRYAFRGVAPTRLGRLWAGFGVVWSPFLAVLLWPSVWSPMWALIGLISLYDLLRRAEPRWYVELQDSAILVKTLGVRKIRYRDIRSAGFYVYRYGTLARVALNADIAFFRLLGQRARAVGTDGEVARDTVELNFGCWRLLCVLFPPFLFPYRALRFRVEDASGLLAELQGRLSHSPSGPSP